MILSLPPDGEKKWSLLSALTALQEFPSYLQLKRTHKMAHPFTAPISGSYSMVRSSRLIQSCQLPLGTALQEDLRGACGDGCQPTPRSPVESEGEEAGVGSHLGGRRGWCWGSLQWLVEAASPVPRPRACLLGLPRSGTAASWSERCREAPPAFGEPLREPEMRDAEPGHGCSLLR